VRRDSTRSAVERREGGEARLVVDPLDARQKSRFACVAIDLLVASTGCAEGRTQGQDAPRTPFLQDMHHHSSLHCI
jgi:hypothetical protein